MDNMYLIALLSFILGVLLMAAITVTYVKEPMVVESTECPKDYWKKVEDRMLVCEFEYLCDCGGIR